MSGQSPGRVVKKEGQRRVGPSHKEKRQQARRQAAPRPGRAPCSKNAGGAQARAPRAVKKVALFTLDHSPTPFPPPPFFSPQNSHHESGRTWRTLLRAAAWPWGEEVGGVGCVCVTRSGWHAFFFAVHTHAVMMRVCVSGARVAAQAGGVSGRRWGEQVDGM